MSQWKSKSHNLSEGLKLTFQSAKWPNIELDKVIKQDLKKSFEMFDQKCSGFVTVEALRVALRALGHDLTVSERESLHRLFPTNEVDFGEYLALLSEWILSIDSDEDIAKAFALVDTDDKGYIDINNLHKIIDELNLDKHVGDDELMAMLIGAQHKNTATELKEQYDEHQRIRRLQRGQGYASQNMGISPSGQQLMSMRMPGHGTYRKSSSSVQVNSDDITVSFDNFKWIMQLNNPPNEEI